MNYLDSYDLSGSGAPAAPPPPAQQSLNEEVNEVLGQITSFWGGFTKQSRGALESARKLDFSQVVSQAQKEFTKLTATGEATTSSSTTARDPDAPSASSSEEKTETPDSPTTPTPGSSANISTTTSVQSLFSRLQSAIPPNVIATVQANLPESIKHASENGLNIDIAHLRETLSTEFTRVQGVTRTQAEEYMRKSEVFLKDAQEVLKDAVKVIPPEEADKQPGFVWDGTDMWMLPTEPTGAAAETDVKGKGKAKDTAQQSVSTRAEALLRRLRHDPEIMGHNLEDDSAYKAWCENEKVDGDWKARAEKELGDGPDGQALRNTRDTLVPSKLTEDEFWRRYYFRVHQIQSEEEKRKALIEGSISTDEDFSWEDDDEEESAAAATPPPETPKTLEAKTSNTTLRAPPGVTAAPSTATSPRESSDGSYAVIGAASTTLKTTDVKGTDKKDEDSDDDDDEEEDDDDEDDDEDDSDDDEDEDSDEDEDDDEDNTSGKGQVQEKVKEKAPEEKKKGATEEGESSESDWE